MKTHSSPKITSYEWAVFTDAKAPFLLDMIGYVASESPRIIEAGVSGYSVISLSQPNPDPIPGVPTHVGGYFGTLLLQDNNNPAALEKIFKPINDALQSRWKGKAFIFASPKQYDSFLAWFSENYDKDPADTNAYLVSRLLDKQAFSDPAALGKTLAVSSKPTGSVLFFFIAGKGTHEAKPAGGSNGLNPAWRRAYIQTST